MKKCVPQEILVVFSIVPVLLLESWEYANSFIRIAGLFLRHCHDDWSHFGFHRGQSLPWSRVGHDSPRDLCVFRFGQPTRLCRHLNIRSARWRRSIITKERWNVELLNTRKPIEVRRNKKPFAQFENMFEKCWLCKSVSKLSSQICERIVLDITYLICGIYIVNK